MLSHLNCFSGSNVQSRSFADINALDQAIIAGHQIPSLNDRRQWQWGIEMRKQIPIAGGFPPEQIVESIRIDRNHDQAGLSRKVFMNGFCQLMSG